MVNFEDKNVLFSIWIKNKPSENIKDCVNSWLDVGYIVILFVENHLILEFNSKDNLILLDIDEFDIAPNYLKEFPQIYSDYFRYNFLKVFGGTYIDSDIFLLKRIPDDDIIINTEYTNQSGAFKSKDIMRPTNNLMRFPKNDELISSLVDLINSKEIKSNNKNNNVLLVPYIQLLKKNTDYQQYYLHPKFLSPYSFSTIKHLGLNDGVESKFDVPVAKIEDVIKNSWGIHLYNNLHSSRKDLTKIILGKKTQIPYNPTDMS